MDNTRNLIIQSEMDVITARMHVREMAGALGMDLVNQARISLATSSLAHALGLGSMHPGRIVIEYLQEGKCAGLRVTCVTSDDTPEPAKALSEVRWMVDEMTIEKLPSSELQVALTKWSTGGE